ncbi:MULTISPECIES: SDR family oxidoreductase [Arthrobacter]|uniref:Short-subunit dehydrogenase n=1 Tax=Arthrobacter bambusae TaxID=1338426 RepID=A0AAW8DJZ8_9MICC|nr:MULTISPECIES: SDR family oxidoreductase [Arthrobacter]MDP9907279.1 short-subunit dehydrogenase [Arthrobacter bambusae]MDQ0131415.1 short-subunit dehydrogenase [Arthrobacter bambusae]MDQ0182749.1 short-subunit dehydrogenase [Arthrobacter bambusae]
MPTIAIVGAGPGLGLALAKQFGRNGYSAALIARNPQKLDGLVEALNREGIEAAGFPADTADSLALRDALASASSRFGGIQVLEYSPYTAGPGFMVNPLDVTVENLREPVDSLLFGTVAAVQSVLPAMRQAGQGTILITAGVGSIDPVPFFGTLNAAQAAARNWTLNLRSQLVDSGVYVAHIAVGLMIGDNAPDGYPSMSADEIAKIYWEMHLSRSEAERIIA